MTPQPLEGTMNIDGSLGETTSSGCPIHNNSSGSINLNMSMQKRSSNSLRRLSSTNHPYHERVVELPPTTSTLLLQRRNSKQPLSTSFTKRDSSISRDSSLSSMDSASTRTSGGAGGGKLRSSFSSLKRNKISHNNSSHASLKILQRTTGLAGSTSQLGKLMRSRQTSNSSSRELLLRSSSRSGLSRSSSRNNNNNNNPSVLLSDRINSNGSWGTTTASSLRKSSQSTPVIRGNGHLMNKHNQPPYSPASNRNNGQRRSVLSINNTSAVAALEDTASSSNKNAEWNVTPLSSRRVNPFTLKMPLAPPAPTVNASMPRQVVASVGSQSGVPSSHRQSRTSSSINPMQTMLQTGVVQHDDNVVRKKNLHQSSSNLLKTLLDMSNNNNGVDRSGVTSCVENGPIVSSSHQPPLGVVSCVDNGPILSRATDLLPRADSTLKEEEKKISVLPSPNVPGLVEAGDSINHTAVVVVDQVDAIDSTSTSAASNSADNDKLEKLVQENDTVAVVGEEEEEGTTDSTVNKATPVQSDATAIVATDKNDTTTKLRSNSWSTYPWIDSCSSLLASFTSPFRGLVTRSSSIVSNDNPQEPISEGQDVPKRPSHYPPRTPTKVRFSTMEDIISYEVTPEDIKKSWNVLNVPQTLKNIEMISRHRGISVIYSDSAYTAGKTCMVHIEPVPLINEVLVARERHRTAVFREQTRLKEELLELECCVPNGDDVEEQLAEVAARYSRWGVELALSSWWLER